MEQTEWHIARTPSRETTLTIRQIAERLHLGSWKSLNHKLYLLKKAAKITQINEFAPTACARAKAKD